jgi:hypothetical protein
MGSIYTDIDMTLHILLAGFAEVQGKRSGEVTRKGYQEYLVEENQTPRVGTDSLY